MAVNKHVDAASNSLKVYKSDGTTELGDFVQVGVFDDNACDAEAVYTDDGVLHKLDSSNCATLCGTGDCIIK